MPPKYTAWVWVVVTNYPKALSLGHDGLLYYSSAATSFSTRAAAQKALRKTSKQFWARRAGLRIIRIAITDQSQVGC